MDGKKPWPVCYHGKTRQKLIQAIGYELLRAGKKKFSQKGKNEAANSRWKSHAISLLLRGEAGRKFSFSRISASGTSAAFCFSSRFEAGFRAVCSGGICNIIANLCRLIFISLVKLAPAGKFGARWMLPLN